MESKYYTPTIEEFHVGFIFESQDIENAQWGECICTPGFGAFDEDINSLEEGRIRVKYLDKEGIESLEFKQEGKIYKDKWGNSLELTGYPNYDCRIILVYSSRKFEGKIKNKSEFKRILKQLGL
jgi:hypothetical protein